MSFYNFCLGLFFWWLFFDNVYIRGTRFFHIRFWFSTMIIFPLCSFPWLFHFFSITFSTHLINISNNKTLIIWLYLRLLIKSFSDRKWLINIFLFLSNFKRFIFHIHLHNLVEFITTDFILSNIIRSTIFHFI